MNEYLKKVIYDNKFDYENEVIHVKDAIPSDVGEMLHELILEHKPKVSLEIGLCHGISSMYICDALKEVGGEKHHIIDPGLEVNKYGLHNLDQCGLKGFYQHYDDVSESRLPIMWKEGLKVDFVFLDGWQTLDQLMLDFFYIDKILNIGGVVAFDDCEMQSVKSAVSYFIQYPSYEELFSYIYRCRSIKKISEDNRNWDWHTIK